jgi:hypothetical protein
MQTRTGQNTSNRAKNTKHPRRNRSKTKLAEIGTSKLDRRGTETVLNGKKEQKKKQKQTDPQILNQNRKTK